jgi:hypothetical protein
VKISFEQGLTLTIGYTDEALSIKTSAVPAFVSSGLLGNNQVKGRKSGIVVSELDSQSKDYGFESRLIQILDGNYVSLNLGMVLVKDLLKV